MANGGDPEAMSLTQYLDLAYAVVVDERVRRGSTLFDALEQTAEWAAGGRPPVAAITTPVTHAGGNTMERDVGKADIGGPGAALTPEEIAQAQQMAIFNQAMSNVGGVG